MQKYATNIVLHKPGVPWF